MNAFTPEQSGNEPHKTGGLIDIATRRRVTIGMGILAIIIFGMVSLGRLKVTLLPDLSYPTLTLRTELPGAAPEEIETLLTKQIEEASGVVKNLKKIRSVSRAGQSDVTLEFNWGTDMNLASIDVREKVDLLNLPDDASKPILLRFDPSSEPISRYALVAGESKDSSNGQSFSEPIKELKRLRRFADERLKTDLESVEGTASVKISGGYEDEIQILIDQERLAQKSLSIQDIANKLQQENVNLSGGQIEEDSRRFQVRTVNQFKSVDDIANTIIAINPDLPGQYTYLKEIADVSLGFKERKAIIRVDGREAIELAVYKEGDANTVQVAKRIRKRIENYESNIKKDDRLADTNETVADAQLGPTAGFGRVKKQSLPQNSELKLLQDQSTFISSAISEVRQSALFGGLLAILVLYGFLRDARSTIIIGLTIPVSVIGTFALMYKFNLSLNIMSLGGIALAIGLLVDNSIVVLENIAQKREEGLGRLAAARQGTQQVAMAVTASTFTTVAVFFPMVFISGIAGQLFKDQALTVSFALLFSLLVALTMIPMLSTIGTSQRFQEEALDRDELLQRKKTNFIPLLFVKILSYLYKGIAFVLHNLFRPFVWAFNKLYDFLASGYPALLRWSLNNRLIVMTLTLVAFTASMALVPRLGTELIPQLAQGEFYSDIRLAPGSPIDSTDNVLNQVQDTFKDDKRVKITNSVAGTGNRLDAAPIDSGDNTGRFNIQINSAQNPDYEDNVREELRSLLDDVPGIKVEFGKPELVNFSSPLQVEISGYDLNRLKISSDNVVALMNDMPEFADVRSTIELGQPEIQIIADPQRASQLGLSERDIANSVVNKVRGNIATKFSWRDRKIDVLIKSVDSTNTSRAEIEQLIINPQSDRPIRLSSVADIIETIGPASINRVDQTRVALISASVINTDIGNAVQNLQNALDNLQFSDGVSVQIKGQSEDMEQAFDSMKFAMILAVFLVYLVMASQFESLIHPFVILFTIPLAMIGSVIALYVTNTTINVVALIGLIMLAGIVVNNGIVLIDLINQYRQSGQDKFLAIVKGGKDRLRPIIMTALTTILGLIPMAIGLGEGSEIRTPMAITVIGGMLVATLLTLVVIPVMYSLLDFKKYQSVTE